MLRLTTCLVLALAAPAFAKVSAAPEPIAQAVASENRPAADRDRDGLRHPAAVLAFAGVEPGMAIGEYMPGGGYFTRILSGAVGAHGHVYAYMPSEIVAMRASFLTDIQAVAASPGMGNVVVISEPTRAFAAPEPLDMVFTAQNYHDLYGRFAPEGTGAAFDQAVFAALKPGGVYLVIDHSALAGTGLTGAAPLHRIDRQAAIQAIQSVGFVLEAESDLLAQADDPQTASVFDSSIRGQTDQFMLRFRKPD